MVESVRVVAQVGTQVVGEKVAVAPAGSPEAEKDTDCDVPESKVAVMVLETVAPWTTVWSPLLASEKSKAGGEAVTVKVKLVGWLSSPAVPVTVMREEPGGVDAVVVSVRVVAQVGVHAVGEKVAVAPAGSPEVEKDTDCDAPESKVAVMVLETVAPWTTDWFPLLVREKSKGGGGAVTVKRKLVVLVRLPAFPVTVMV